MGQSVTNLGGAAMRVYDKVVHEQVFTKNVLYNNILRNTWQSANGSTTKYFSTHYGRNIGSAAGSETLTLPTAGNQAYLQMSVGMKYNFHSISVTDVAIQASKKSPEFLVNALESEFNGAKNDMQRQLSRQGYGMGTGVICRINDAIGDATITFDSPYAGKHPTDYFSVGDAIMTDSTNGSATSAAYTTVTAISSGYIMTVTSEAGTADNDYVYLAHYDGDTSPSVSNINSEVMGLQGLIDDASNVSTFEGQSRATYNWWNSYVDDNSTQRSLTEALMHTTFSESKKFGNPKYILTHWDLLSAYGQLLSPDRRYTDKLTLKGGFTGLSFNDIPVIADYDCPYDEMYFIDPSTLSVEDLSPISFLDEDGSKLFRSSTQPIWQGTLRYYANIANKACNKSAVLRDVIK